MHIFAGVKNLIRFLFVNQVVINNAYSFCNQLSFESEAAFRYNPIYSRVKNYHFNFINKV